MVGHDGYAAVPENDESIRLSGEYLLIDTSIVVVPTTMPATMPTPIMRPAVIAFPMSVAAPSPVIVVVTIVAVGAIVIPTPPAAAPFITNPANLIHIGRRGQRWSDRHRIGGCHGQATQSRSRRNSQEHLSH